MARTASIGCRRAAAVMAALMRGPATAPEVAALVFSEHDPSCLTPVREMMEHLVDLGVAQVLRNDRFGDPVVLLNLFPYGDAQAPALDKRGEVPCLRA